MTGYCCLACGRESGRAYAGATCPHCGGNLDITYDYASIAKAAGGRFPDEGKGIFRYAALLPLRSVPESPPLRVGNTPLIPAPRLGEPVGLPHVFLKDDSLMPSASFKDRATLVALCRAREQGESVVATASTGNAGASLACQAAASGMPCVLFVPESAPSAKLAQLLVFGAKVLAVRGSYDMAFDLCQQACESFGWFNRSTGLNPFTREGKKTCSYEIWEALGGQAPDWIAVPTGDGNILSGIWKGWRDLRELGWVDRMPRMLCVQSQSSAAIARTVQGLTPHPNWSEVQIKPVHASTVADSIAVDLPRDGLAAVRAVVESEGAAVTVSDAEILSAIPEVARATGIFPEPAAAAAWSGVKHAAREHRIRAADQVVCLITGSGLKDVAHARESVGEPSIIPPSLDAVDRAVAGWI